MSKRSRRKRNDESSPKAQAMSVGQGNGAKPLVEPEMVFSGQAYLQFDQWMDHQLETMVEKWIHCAAPAALSVRRVCSQGSRRTTGQA